MIVRDLLTIRIDRHDEVVRIRWGTETAWLTDAEARRIAARLLACSDGRAAETLMSTEELATAAGKVASAVAEVTSIFVRPRRRP